METKRYKISETAGKWIAGVQISDGQTHIDLTEEQAKYGLMQGELTLEVQAAATGDAEAEAGGETEGADAEGAEASDEGKSAQAAETKAGRRKGAKA